MCWQKWVQAMGRWLWHIVTACAWCRLLSDEIKASEIWTIFIQQCNKDVMFSMRNYRGPLALNAISTAHAAPGSRSNWTVYGHNGSDLHLNPPNLTMGGGGGGGGDCRHGEGGNIARNPGHHPEPLYPLYTCCANSFNTTRTKENATSFSSPCPSADSAYTCALTLPSLLERC